MKLGKIKLDGVISICEKKIFYFFLLIWFFELTYFTTIPWLDKLYTLGKVVSAVIIFMLCIQKRDYKITIKERISRISVPFIWAVVIYEAILVLRTLVCGGAVVSAVIAAGSLIVLVMALNYMLSTDAKGTLNILMLIFELIIYCNFATVILFPKGLYHIREGAERFYWLVGHQNATILYVLCAIVIAVLFSKYGGEDNNGKMGLRSVLLIFVSCATIVIIWSATAIFGLFVFGLLLFFNRKGVKLSVRIAIVCSLLFFLAIVVFRMQDYFSVIIVNVLHRDVTFTNRTVIWDKAMKCIQQHPILGYGVELSKVARQRFGFNTTHNKYLYTLYQGGGLLFVSFLTVLYSVTKPLKKHAGSVAAIVITASIWALLIQMQFESYTLTVFYIPFILAGQLDSIIGANSPPAGQVKDETKNG